MSEFGIYVRKKVLWATAGVGLAGKILDKHLPGHENHDSSSDDMPGQSMLSPGDQSQTPTVPAGTTINNNHNYNQNMIINPVVGRPVTGARFTQD